GTAEMPPQRRRRRNLAIAARRLRRLRTARRGPRCRPRLLLLHRRLAVSFKTGPLPDATFVAHCQEEQAMTRLYQTRTVSVSIRRDWRDVYDFACEPES